LPLLAMHGFVVLASNSIPGIGAEADLGMEMATAIDWAFAENGREGSQFLGKLDTTKVAAMGYSMFVGPQCGVCMDANWKVKQKSLQ
jgi:hypothetical protein